MMFKSWMRFALSEGCAATASRVVQKSVGRIAPTFLGVVYATLIIGAVQMLGSIFIVTRRRAVLFPGWSIIGSVVFGISAFIGTILGFYAFTYETVDVAVVTFIALISATVAGSVIDWIFFKTRLDVWQSCGMGVFFFAGWSMLDFPEMRSLLWLYPWVWLTVFAAITVAINEGVTRKLSLVPLADPFVHNFWVGLTTLLLSLVVITGLGQWNELPNGIELRSVIIGLIVIALVSSKFLSYKAGGTIVFKKLLMWGAMLISAVVVGVFIGESMSIGKIVGTGGFFLAFSLMNKGRE